MTDETNKADKASCSSNDSDKKNCSVLTETKVADTNLPSETLLERIYHKLGYNKLGTFLYQTILFGFAVILFVYLLLGIPQEAGLYEVYKPYIDKVASCIGNKTTPEVYCMIDLNKSISNGLR